MKADLKQKWIEALRSGKYKQGFDLLRSEERYCCLGVLHDVANGRWTAEGDGAYSLKGEFGNLGDGEHGLDIVTQNVLTVKNDGYETFAQIADYIEANIPETP